jgi:hypothetical protein
MFNKSVDKIMAPILTAIEDLDKVYTEQSQKAAELEAKAVNARVEASRATKFSAKLSALLSD